MKRFLFALVPLLSISVLTGCAKDNGKTNDEKTGLWLDDDTPKWWIDMWTFENVSIKATCGIEGTESGIYKVVNNKMYFCKEGSSKYDLVMSDDYTFVMYLVNYDEFGISEFSRSCTVSWYKYEGNYVHYYSTLSIDYYGRIEKITEKAYSKSSIYYETNTYTFYNYDTTVL